MNSRGTSLARDVPWREQRHAHDRRQRRPDDVGLDEADALVALEPARDRQQAGAGGAPTIRQSAPSGPGRRTRPTAPAARRRRRRPPPRPGPARSRPAGAMAAASTAGMGLMAVAVVVADAAPWSSMSQTQMAVTTISPTETRWRATIVGLQYPAHERRERQQHQRVADVQHADELARRGAVRELLADEGLAGVGAARPGARTGPRSRTLRLVRNRCAAVVSSAQPDCKRYRYRQASAPRPEGQGDRDQDRVHGAAGPPGPDGPLGRPEDLDLPEDHRGARGRPLGRGRDAGQLLRRRGERLLHPVPPVDRRPQRVPPRQGCRPRT